MNDTVDTSPFTCWGRFANSEAMADVGFTQISIAMETSGRGGGTGSLTIYSLQWTGT
jgi:hypothetical protein